MMMMIPEAYQGRDDLSPELKGFYAYHQCLMEAWDGPAAIAFTDGRVIGATLDRNGLRPGRWLETKDGWVVLASETGVLDEPAENILRKGRLQPGKLFLVDLDRGRIVGDEEIKREVATRRRYAEWCRAGGRPLLRPARTGAARAADRVVAPAPARLRLHAGRHEGDPRAARTERRGGGRLDGQRLSARRALRPQAASLLVLQATLRPGDEPAGGLDPRGGRDECAGERRLGAEPARRDAGACSSACDRQPDPARLRARAPATGRFVDLQGRHARHHVGGCRGPGGNGASPGGPVPGG